VYLVEVTSQFASTVAVAAAAEREVPSSLAGVTWVEVLVSVEPAGLVAVVVVGWGTVHRIGPRGMQNHVAGQRPDPAVVASEVAECREVQEAVGRLPVVVVVVAAVV
jgi:hypothetical protein